MPQSVISEHITITPETLAKQGIPGQNKEKQNNDKSTIHLPRQCLRNVAKTLILLEFLDENVEFTPYLYIWKIGSVVKVCGSYKRYEVSIFDKLISSELG
nr:MAG TPA: hypothetical protein [Caudoviricetes sp.]